MNQIKLKLVKDVVNGIEMSFLDSINSWTVTEVFDELKQNPYGIEDAKLSENDVLIDVGANIGMFSIYAHMKYGCEIIAFEPIKDNYENFKRNILLNNLNPNKFKLFNCAITNVENDIIKLGKFDHNSGGATQIYNYVNNFEECKTDTLSKYITPKCKFLKIDCEGSEYELIPTIIDKLNQFDYVGIEYHETNVNSPYDLQKTIKNNFKGKLYPEEIVRVVEIKPYLI